MLIILQNIAYVFTKSLRFKLKGMFIFTIQIKVLGKVTCRLGCLLLTSQNVELMGGEVDSLKEENSAWNLLHRAM